MKKLNFYVGVSLLLSIQWVNAQDIFKQHGFDKEPLTLSNGRYNEFFQNDEVVQIGTVLLNTKTNKVIAFIDEDTAKATYLAELSTRWLSPDPLAAKYPEFSPYVFCNNNSINAIDPDGKDVILLVWATANGSYGHSAIGISNYKEVTERVSINGEWVNQTRMVEDGTYTFYELGPATGEKLGLGNFSADVNGYYGKVENVTKYELKKNSMNNEIISKYEEYAADGIIQINTNYANDTRAKASLDKTIDSDQKYNGVTNNCTTYATKGVCIATGQAVNALEIIQTNNTGVVTMTPNRLYKAAKNLPNSTVVKDPGKLIDFGFIEGKTNGAIKQNYVEKYY